MKYQVKILKDIAHICIEEYDVISNVAVADAINAALENENANIFSANNNTLHVIIERCNEVVTEYGDDYDDIFDDFDDFDTL